MDWRSAIVPLLALALAVVGQNCSSNIVDPILQGMPVKISPINCTGQCRGPIITSSGYDPNGTSNSSDFWNNTVESIYMSLPAILSMYYPKFSNETVTRLASDGAPLLADALGDALQHQFNTSSPPNDANCSSSHSVRRHHQDDRQSLARRDIFGDIANWFSDIGSTIEDGVDDGACAVFAGASDFGFQAAAGVFASANPTGYGVTDQQMFFARAAMGPIPDNVGIFYEATFAPFFGGTLGVTFDTAIYTKLARIDTAAYNTDDIFHVDGFFSFTTGIIVHELQHVLQYQSFGWNLWNFGYQYLYAYCQAGFKYYQNSYEAQAFATEGSINPLLSSPGSAFYNIWGSKDLKGQLGFPTTVSPNYYTWNGEPTESLDFDYGRLEIRQSTACYRVWTGQDLGTLNAGTCQIVPVPPYHQPTKPCPPQCGRPVDPAAVAARNKKCKAAKAKASDVYTKKPWICP